MSVYSSAFAGTKLYCLVTEAHRCEKLAQSFYAVVPGRDSKPRLLVASPTLYYDASHVHIKNFAAAFVFRAFANGKGLLPVLYCVYVFFEYLQQYKWLLASSVIDFK